VHGHDRAAAIAKMREALNAFVIRGISSNVPFQSALLAHPKFVAGDFNTGFIAEQYPHGFSAEEVPHEDPDLLLVLAAAAHRRVLERAGRITGQLPGHELEIGEQFVVVAHAGEQVTRTPLRIRNGEGRFRVTIGERSVDVRFAGALREIAVHGDIDGKPFTAQIERAGLDYRVMHNGRRLTARVLTPRAAELQALMPFKPPPDLSRFLLSPMPGLLVDIAVQPGQKVLAGEKLAVIEAMKMENILVAQQDGVIAKITANKGESLAVDQIILEFMA
jgi:propionyl-CoA carboxylase alpha chain